MNTLDVSSLGSLAEEYHKLVEKQGSDKNIYLKLEEGKPKLVGHRYRLPGFLERARSPAQFKFQPLAKKMEEIYKKELEAVSQSKSQLNEEQLEKLNKFTQWFKARVEKYNKPSLLTSLFPSAKRENIVTTAPADLTTIRKRFFKNQTQELIKLLPSLKGEEGKKLAQRLSIRLGEPNGFSTIKEAEEAIKQVILSSLREDRDLIESLGFNCKNEKLFLTDLNKQGQLAENLFDTLWKDPPPPLNDLTLAAKDLIQISDTLAKLQESYKQKFEQEKFPQWEATFNKLYEKISGLPQKQGVPTKEDREKQIQNFKEQFHVYKQIMLLEQDIPQSKAFELLQEDIEAYIHREFHESI